MPAEECQKKDNCYGAISSKDKADNRGVAEGQDEYINGTTGLPVGIHGPGRPMVGRLGWLALAYLNENS